MTNKELVVFTAIMMQLRSEIPYYTYIKFCSKLAYGLNLEVDRDTFLTACGVFDRSECEHINYGRPNTWKGNQNGKD